MPKGKILALCALLLLIGVGVAGCGGDSHGEGSGEVTKATGEDAVRAFLEGMVPHHSSAVEMATVALERSEAPLIRRVATDITRTQNAEIAQMESIHRRLFGSELTPDEAAHERLGLSADEAGMGHMDAAMMLEEAEPFDRAFVDEMVGHHRGAIAMAEAVLAQADDPEVKKLASTIVTEQRREIRELNEFRTETFGTPVPASAGTSNGEDGSGEMEGMGH